MSKELIYPNGAGSVVRATDTGQGLTVNVGGVVNGWADTVAIDLFDITPNADTFPRMWGGGGMLYTSIIGRDTGDYNIRSSAHWLAFGARDSTFTHFTATENNTNEYNNVVNGVTVSITGAFTADDLRVRFTPTITATEALDTDDDYVSWQFVGTVVCPYTPLEINSLTS